MKDQLRIVHLEDDACDADLVARKLAEGGVKCVINRVKSRRDFELALEKQDFDLIASDYSLPAFDGLSALRIARSKCPEIPFIFVSGTIGEERAVESLKEGATDYVIKDRLSRLVPAIKRAIAEAEARRQRKLADEQIRQQATLLDQAQDAISLNDMDQGILYWNKSAERLYGWPAREALGRNANEILFQHDLTAPHEAFKSLIRRGEWQGELDQVTKDGKQIMVESRWTLMRDDRGEPKSILVINTDITAKKKIEAQLLRTQRMESIGALAGGIAHDFNNALTPVLMALAYMQEEPISDDSKRLLTLAQASAQRSVEMIKQILTFSRGTGGEHSQLQLRQIVVEMAGLMRDTFPKSVKIETNIPSALNFVKGNATQLHQVVMNLCVNARDAMPNGGWLRIEASNVSLNEDNLHGQSSRPGPYVLISVSDTGCGIPHEVLDQIFEPFFTTKETGKGTGLGLSTVMGIVKTHGGFVDVASKVGHGTTFRVYLPAFGPTSAAPAEPQWISSPVGHNEEILLIDDEGTVLEVTKLMLESFNYRVLTARHGAEGLKIYQEHKGEIKVVITDMMMPLMDGPATIHALREMDPHVKIIGMTGLGIDTPLARAARPKVQAFLKKPFATEELLVSLSRIVNEPVAP